MDKPEIDFPEGPPPADLEITDVVEGDGQEATSGSTVRVHYVGVAHSTGEEFDASYNRGTPLEFRLGVGQVIQGWDTGVQGMKVGGRRKLVIPPHLGYGDRGAGGVIRPGETLIFVCDLIAVDWAWPRSRLPGLASRPAFIRGARRLGLTLADVRDLLAVRDTGDCQCPPDCGCRCG
jgi:peptidylprolyl isomerase